MRDRCWDEENRDDEYALISYRERDMVGAYGFCTSTIVLNYIEFHVFWAVCLYVFLDAWMLRLRLDRGMRVLDL